MGAKTCSHNVMRWARCLECEIEALRAQVAAHDTLVQRMANNCAAEVSQHEANANRALAECQALVAKLADCQAVIRSRGHDADCPARLCDECGQLSGYAQHRPSYSIYADEHRFQPGRCSESCGHDRTTGEKE